MSLEMRLRLLDASNLIDAKLVVDRCFDPRES